MGLLFLLTVVTVLLSCNKGSLKMIRRQREQSLQTDGMPTGHRNFNSSMMQRVLKVIKPFV